MLGAAHVVYDDSRDLVENALNCVEFYRNESCGKCVPCRTGSQKLVELIGMMIGKTFQRAQLPLVGELSDTMSIASICGLGQVASNPIASVMKHFPEELDKYLRRRARAALVLRNRQDFRAAPARRERVRIDIVDRTAFTERRPSGSVRWLER